jgi:transcriptional regulator with XRE-family HTH domain
MERRSPDHNQLGELLHKLRVERDLSLRGLAATAGLDATWLMRVERGQYQSPDPRLLRRLAEVLDIDTADLFLAADYRGSEGLPGFAPYLRAKYDLPNEAVEQLAAHFELINEKYVSQVEEGGGNVDDNHQAA